MDKLSCTDLLKNGLVVSRLSFESAGLKPGLGSLCTGHLAVHPLFQAKLMNGYFGKLW